MLHIDPTRLDLVNQFHEFPFGPHGAELLEMLKVLRWAPVDDRHIIAQPSPQGPYQVVKQTGLRDSPLYAVAGETYDNLLAAQCGVFRKRWEAHTGLRLAEQPDGSWATAAPVADEPDILEPLAPVEKPLLAYPDKFSVRPNETIEFKVSATHQGSFRASLVRLRCGDATEGGAGYKEYPVEAAFNGDYPALTQSICAGSYVAFEDDPAWHPRAFTVQGWLWPTTPGLRPQHVAGTWDETGSCGWGLQLDERGAATLVLGDGKRRVAVTSGVPLRERAWTFVTVSYDAETGRVVVLQRPLEKDPHRDRAVHRVEHCDLEPSNGNAFRLAAWHDSDALPHRAGGHYNGKLEAPMLVQRALREPEIEVLLADPVCIDPDGDLIGHWDFSEDFAGTRVVDRGPSGRHGHTVNQPTRAMKGVNWDGSEYNFEHAPAHYGAIHFHDDDLHDCGWDTSFAWTVPSDTRSGIYCAKLEQDGAEYLVPFVVSPPLGESRAPLALILPTASYWAYANHLIYIEWPEIEHVLGFFTVVDETGLFLFQNPAFGMSMYDHHRDGSGVCHSSRLRPVLDLAPKQALWQFPADTHITDWLEAEEIEYDVITEDDLELHGCELLAPYRCVSTGTHPEYPSLRMMDAYAAYQANGGRFIYMGGNGFYWRTHYHPERPGIVEVRRAEDGIRSWAAEGGEYYASFTGELGGMWRRMGRAPQTVAGTGMTAQGFDSSTYFERTPESFDPRVSFVFEGIGNDERIGDFGIIGGGAAGSEIDRADVALGTPPHALVVARADNFSSAYNWMKEEMTHTHTAITGPNCPHVHADVTFYETRNGGAVFAMSSIAWAGALAHNNYDNNIARITGNVVRRFIDSEPFN
ncbi:MAG: N,N-dimethylformamidase beta subunit family domain-containing protein [Gammaproteobacteria bacterium]